MSGPAQSEAKRDHSGGITSLRLYGSDYGCLIYLRDYCRRNVVIPGRISAASIIRWALQRTAREIEARELEESRNVQ